MGNRKNHPQEREISAGKQYAETRRENGGEAGPPPPGKRETGVHDYLKIYLPKQRNISPNTIRSYRKALEELLDYVKDCEQISLGEVTFDHLTTDMILSFLEYLEMEKDCSVLTRNTRFAAFRVFMDYAADREFTLVSNLNKLKKVPFKKSDTTVAVDYMSMAAITAIIEQPDN